VLSVYPDPPEIAPKSATVTARIESSTRGGFPIVADWTFFLSDKGDGWKIDVLIRNGE
jgi:hypothetical protein